MHTEVMRIIEGGLAGDKVKVYNYAKKLAQNLELEGDTKYAKKIFNTLEAKAPNGVQLDSLMSKPVDQESRMDIVDIEVMPQDMPSLVLNPFLESEIEHFVERHESRDVLTKHGVNAQNYLLLYGPPGCGKTSIARRIASETGLPLVTARLDGLVSSLLGSTSKNIRKIFDFASRQDCVLFLDEFDVVAKRRDDENELGELKRVVNSLIQNIDNFGKDSILVAATNHHDLLDPAIWRRFSKVLEVPIPGIREIEEYVSSRIEPQMEGKLKKRQEEALLGLSYSAIDTAAKNALCNALLRGDQKFTSYDLIVETYLATQHGTDDIEEYVEFLIEHGCTLREINEGTGVSMRRIQSISKQLKKGKQ